MKNFFLIVFALLVLFTINSSEAQAADLPNLIIESVDFDPVHKYARPVVRNVSNVSIGSLFAVKQEWLRADGSVTGPTGYFVFPGGMPSRQAWQRPLNGVTPRAEWLPPADAAKVRLTVNPDGHTFLESDFNDNERVLSLFPDLIVTSVTPDNEKIFLIATIKNQSDRGAPRGFKVKRTWLRGDDTPVGYEREDDFPQDIFGNSTGTIEIGTVQTGVPGAVKVRVTVDSINIINEGDKENNNTAVFDIPAPDLVVEAAFSIPDKYYPVARIKNEGTWKTRRGSIFTKFEWLGADGSVVGPPANSTPGTVNIDGNEIEPGKSTPAFIVPSPMPTWWLPPENAVKVRLIVDSADNITESNEDNNVRVFDLPLPRYESPEDKKPDLDIISVRFDPTYGFAIPTVLNKGKGTNIDNFFIRVQWLTSYTDDESFIGWPSHPKFRGNISPGQTQIPYNLPASGAAPPGNWLPLPPAVRVKLQISGGSSGPIEDSDYTNNVKFFNRAQPDLIVESITFDSERSYAKPIIKNQGAGALINQFNTSQEWLRADGSVIGEADIASGPELASGATSTPYLASIGTPKIYYFSSPPGDAVKVRITADYDNSVSESDEDNNVSTVDLPKPDLSVVALGFDEDKGYPKPSVKNAGVRFITIYDVKLTWLSDDEAIVGSPIILRGENIGAGEVQQLISAGQDVPNEWLPPEGAVKIRLEIDPENKINEAYETNNRWTYDRPTPEAEDMKYPIKELGNCKSKENCKAYCDKSENKDACAKYGVETGLLTEEEGKAAEEIDDINEDNPGPGNCTTKESCAEFCAAPANVEACLNYAEKNNWMSADDLSKARKVAGVLKTGGATPGACNTLDGCKTYCSDNTHAVECVAFGKSAGLLSSEEVTEAEKVAPLMQSGQMPGGKKTREELEAYCESNRDECDKFFEQAGVKKGNGPEGEGPKGGPEEGQKEAPSSIFEGKEGGGPGGCKTKDECDAYCDSHPGECDEQVRQAGGEVKEATATCSTKEECEAFCNDPANKEVEACKSGAIIIKKESPESAGPTEGPGEDPIEKLRSDIQEIISQSKSQDCVKRILGEEVFTKFVIEGGMPEKAISREALQPCFEEAKNVIEQEETIKMQKKPDDPDMGNPPPQSPTSQLQKISTMFASVLNGVWLFQADPTRKPLFMPESKYYCNTEHNKCISKLRSCYYDRDENFDQCRETYRLGEKQCTDRLVDCVKDDPNIGTGAGQNISEPQKSEQTGKPKPSEPEKETRCSGAHQEYDSDLKECACVLGYWQRPDSTCRESITYRLSLDVDSAEEVENLVDTLKTNNRQLLTLTLQNGETLRLGVIKLGNGQIIFTKDGERFYNNLGHTIKPSFMRRAVQGVGNLISWLNPLRRFHTPLTDKYPGENADRETKWQIARNVLKDLEKTLEKEKELAEYLNDIREKLSDHKDNLEEIEAILRLGGESDDVISVLADMGRDEIKGFLKDKLISFPAETIKELHDQLNTDDFAEGVRVYIGQREIDYTPEQVFDDPPEDLITSGSVAREYDLGKRLLFIKYEEAYQRYLLSKEFNK